MKTNHCPVCNSEKTQFLHICQDYTVSQEKFEIWECKNCQTAFTQNVPAADQIGKYYQSENYVSHSDSKKGVINKLYHIARNLMLKSKVNLVKKSFGKAEGNILDIGCGTGYFLSGMKKANWKTTGIEEDSKARQFAIKNFDLAVYSPNKLFDANLPTFDVISLWHVLEHLHDFKNYLSQIRSKLSDHGKLIIAVPNFHSSDSQHYKQFWAGYDVPRHLWHFSPKSMEFLANEFKFEIISQKTMPFDPFYVSLLSEKYKKNALALVSGFWHGFWSFVAGSMNIEKSSSVIYVLKKKLD